MSLSRMALFACSLLAGMSGAEHVQASSPDAWEEFQQEVESSCVAASQGMLQVMSVTVDPYGSESYGFAVLTGFEKGNPKQRMLVCAYSKRDQRAEISAPFDL
jgi:hypothetical protein